MPRATPSSPSPLSSSSSGAEQFLHMLREPQIEALLHLLQRRAGQLLVGEQPHAPASAVAPGDDLADRLAEPADRPVVGEHECVVHRVEDARRARLDLAGQRFLRGGVQRLRRFAVACGSAVKRNPWS